MIAKPSRRFINRVLCLLAIFVLTCSAFLLLPMRHAKAEDGGYPWANASDVNVSQYEWGYTTCPDNDTGCKVVTDKDSKGTTYGLIDPYGYYLRNCTSFVAWKLDTVNGWNHGGSIGGAYAWKNWASANNYTVDQNPAVGSVAWFSYTHVAWVSALNTNGTVQIQEYNYDYNGHYNTRSIAKTSAWYLHFKDLSSSPTPTPTPAPVANILTVKSGLSPDGAIEVYAATSGRVTQCWYRNGGDGPHTATIIDISQNNIVGIDKLNFAGSEFVYTAVPDGVWETTWLPNVTSPHHTKIVKDLVGVRGVIAEVTLENGYAINHWYILAQDGVYEAYRRGDDPTHTVHISRLMQITGGVAFTHSIAPNGAEQLYVAVPTWVYEVSWFPYGTVNSQPVINIPQGDIRSVEKGANLPDGGELLYTTTSTTVWQSYRNGTGAFNAPGTVATGQTNALQGLKSVTPDGWHRVFLALPDHVQEYKWLGSSSGGGEVIRISQGNIKAIAQQLDGNNQLLFTAAGSDVWETWWNANTGYNTAPSALFSVSA